MEISSKADGGKEREREFLDKICLLYYLHF